MSDQRPPEGASKDPAPSPFAKSADEPLFAAGAAGPLGGAEAPPPHDPDREPPPAAEPPRDPAPRRAAAWPLALLLLVIAAVAASPYWAPTVGALLPWGQRPDNAADEQIRTLDQRLGQLEQRSAAAPGNGNAQELAQLRAAVDAANQKVAGLEQLLAQLATTAPSGGDTQGLADAQRQTAERLAALEPKLAALEPRLAELDRRVAETPAVDPAAVQGLQSDLRKVALTQTELADRLAKIEQAVQNQTASDRTDQMLLLSLNRLRGATESSRPYAGELGAAKALAQSRPDVAEALRPLDARAEKGIPTRAVLAQRFGATANAIARAERAPPGDDWGDQALAKLKGLVTVRRVGQSAVEGGPDAALASAEAALKDGDLSGAVAALETLQGAPAEAAKPWLDDARARVAAEAALDKAETSVTQRMAATSGDSGNAGKPR
jgi:hypothetical protein